LSRTAQQPLRFDASVDAPVIYSRTVQEELQFFIRSDAQITYSRTVQESLRFDVDVDRLVNLSRTVQQPLSFDTNVDRLVNLSRTAQQPLSFDASVDAPVIYSRTVQQPLRFDASVDAPIIYSRTVQESLRFDVDVDRLVNLSRTAQQPLRFDTNVDRLVNLSRTAQESLSFADSTDSQLTGWFNNNWMFRKKITIDKDQVIDNPHTDFPFLLSLPSDSDLATNAQDDGDDILFTLVDGTTMVDHEIERFDGSTGELVAWIEIPSLLSSSDTILYMYYHNIFASNQQNPTGTWNSNFKMVQHLNEENADQFGEDYLDSTSNDNDGQGGAGNGGKVPTQVTSGKIDGAQDFDGSDDHIQVDDSPSLRVSPDFTVESWFTIDNLNEGPHLLAKQFGDSFFNSYIFWMSATNQIGFHSAISPSQGFCCFLPKDGLTPNAWNHIAVTKQGTTMKLFFNGQEITSINNAPATVPYDSNVLFIGADDNGADDIADSLWNGMIDEMRISNVAHSTGWIATGYNNQNSPDTFSTLGSQERQAVLFITVKDSLSFDTSVDTRVAFPRTVQQSLSFGTSVDTIVTFPTTVQQSLSFGTSVDTIVTFPTTVQQSLSFGTSVDTQQTVFSRTVQQPLSFGTSVDTQQTVFSRTVQQPLSFGTSVDTQQTVFSRTVQQPLSFDTSVDAQKL